MNLSQAARDHITARATRPLIPQWASHWPSLTLPRPSGLQMLALVLVAVVLLPVIYLLLRAVAAGEEGLRYLLDVRTLQVIWNSVALTGAVTFSAALIGVPFAWLTARARLPLRRVWLIGGLLAMVIPSYLGAITYIAAFGPRGLLQQILEPLLGVQRLPSIYGFFGAWLCITLFTFPYIVLPVRAALLGMDPALEEAGRSMGLGRLRVFWRITLPQLRPALATGMLLAALYTLSDFGAVAAMRYNAFTQVIYLQYTSSFDRSRAAVLALVLVGITLLLLVMERRAARITRNYRIGNGAQRQLAPVELGRWRFPALVFCGLVIMLSAVIPVGVLLHWLANSASGFSLSPDVQQIVGNTVGSSGLAALVVGLAALPLGLLAARSASRLNQWLVRLSYLGYVLPGIVVALALVFFMANYVPAWYQTLPVLVLGYATRFLSLGVGATQSALTQVNPCYEEAARSMGFRPWQVALRITTPLARAGILAGVALVFLNVMKELPTTLLLAPTGFKTFATQIWTAHNEAKIATIGTPGLLLMAVSAVSLYFLLRNERSKM